MCPNSCLGSLLSFRQLFPPHQLIPQDFPFPNFHGIKTSLLRERRKAVGQTIKLLLVSVLKGWVVFNPNQKEDLLLQISAGVLKIYTGNTFRGEQGFDVKSTQHVSHAGGVTRSGCRQGCVPFHASPYPR